MLGIEALRSEMKETVDEVKTRNNDVLEILKVVRGVQETINQVSARVPNPPVLIQPSGRLETSESFHTNILCPISETTKVATPAQTVQPPPSSQQPPVDSHPTHAYSQDSRALNLESCQSPTTRHVMDDEVAVVVPSPGSISSAQV